MPKAPIAGSTLRFDRRAIFVGGEPACLLKALYQSGPASDSAVAGYLRFIAAKRLVITIKTSKNLKYQATFYGRFIERL
jgi:hypothetical protein